MAGTEERCCTTSQIPAPASRMTSMINSKLFLVLLVVIKHHLVRNELLNQLPSVNDRDILQEFNSQSRVIKKQVTVHGYFYSIG
jgi:hypothetical protein